MRSTNIGKDIDGVLYPDWSFGWGRFISTDEKTFIDNDNSAHGTTDTRPTALIDTIGRQYLDTTLGKMIYWDGSKWIDADGFKSDSLRVGTTEQRPEFNNITCGFQYFDTTLGKPIFYDDTKWVDATGTEV